MKKVIQIEGMSCNHCKNHVEKALNSLDGVTAKVNLKKKNALVDLTTDVNDDILKKKVTDAGYEVISISEKKGLFSR